MQNAATRNGMAALDPSWVVDFNDMQFFRPIGEGSFGTVYLGRWHETTVAIKVLAQNTTGVQVALNPSSDSLAKSQAPGTGCARPDACIQCRMCCAAWPHAAWPMCSGCMHACGASDCGTQTSQDAGHASYTSHKLKLDCSNVLSLD